MAKNQELTPEKLERWVREGWLRPEQAQRIQEELGWQGQPPSQGQEGLEGLKGLNLLSVLSYLGGLIIISGLGWFLYDQWNGLSSLAQLLLSGGYALLFAAIGYVLRSRLGYPMAGGLLWTCAVWMAPLITFTLEKLALPGQTDPNYHGYYLWIEKNWIPLELATLLAGLAVLYFARFPFVLFPVSFALYFFSMDVAALFQEDHSIDWTTRSWCGVAVGLPMILAGFEVDRRFKEDYSFWLYLFGLMAFWGGLSTLDSDSELGKAIYAAINLGLGFLGIYLQRNVFLVFGTIGFLGYLGHLAYHIFSHSFLFPIMAAFTGLAVILAAVYLQRHRKAIDATLDKYRPARLKIG